ncbi:replicative DNA helicase [Streptomyces verrucosisporus]|uniref:DnaB-like helicase N-terminal domain-containing protein n=1 Tax=Streptomyces verrucosisporus TaxID=1695161 RepID=UPI0019D25172|nr:DnaB-like helicase N-terminal domain-containing protein [Streptomyces verrucosisporus]MBN3933032.1 replicative DNA helicase [Streptomyces verrucosisporus]
MPHAPEPDEEGLDALPPPQPVYYAERALLGALLLEPDRLGDVPGIGPEMFSTAAHRALFAAIRALPAPDPAEHAHSTAWLDQVLTTAREQARGLTASHLHGLIHHCPWPRHAPAYARMVEADHTRRTLRAGAQRLVHTATDRTLPQPVDTTLAEADALASLVDDIAARFPPHSSPLPRTPATVPTTAPDYAKEAIDEERLLLATATAHPGDAERMRWLTAEDFTHPLHAGLWRCLTALTRRRAPIDPVTVLWEAQQRGLLAPGTRPAELLALLAEPVGDPQHWGERILQRSVLSTAHRVGHRIQAYTDTPAATPHQLVTGSRRALADLSAGRARWHHATSPAPTVSPARTRATAPPRAGPPRTTAPPGARISR